MTRIIQTGEAVQQQGAKLTTLIPVHIRRTGGRKVVIPAATSSDPAPEHHTPILTALSRAFHWQRLLDEGRVSSGADIARQEGLNQSSVNELLRLKLLSPEIILALLAGQQPKTLTLTWLKNHELPSDWEMQRQLFGGVGPVGWSITVQSPGCPKTRNSDTIKSRGQTSLTASQLLPTQVRHTD